MLTHILSTSAAYSQLARYFSGSSSCHPLTLASVLHTHCEIAADICILCLYANDGAERRSKGAEMTAHVYVLH